MLSEVGRFIAAEGLLRPGERVGAAVSGGLDSIVLLHVLAALVELQLQLAVCHVDHGLRPESAAEAEYVRDVASRLGLPFILGRVDAGGFARARHLSLEMAARELRYRELRRMASEAGLDRIALGHHRDDQVETVLLRLLRGTSPEGLAGMAPSRDGGLFIRPLLCADRARILAYARERGLEWVEDRSNLEQGIPRNRVRHRLLPLLRAEFNPEVDRALLALADLAREHGDYMRDCLEESWPRLSVRPVPGGVVFMRAGLAGLPRPLGRLALRRLLALAGGDPGRLSWDATARLWRFAQGEGGSRISVPGGFTLARRGEWFYLGLSSLPRLAERILPVPGRVDLPDGRTLAARWHMGNPPPWAGVGRNEAYLDGDALAMPLAIRSRLPGDWFCPLGLAAGAAKKVKETLIEAGIPREERNAVPLVIDAGGRIAWVAGVRPDHRFRVTPNTKHVLYLDLRDARASLS